MAQAQPELGVLSPADRSFLAQRGFDVIGTETIGSSHDHLVFKARRHLDQRLVAVKYLQITNKRKQKYLDREAGIIDHLAKHPHPNIVEVLARVDNQPHNKVFIVMELADRGDLQTFFEQRQWTRIESDLVQNWLGQLSAGVKWCHNLGIAHRDIKLANIIMFGQQEKDHQVRLKLTDFEMATWGFRMVGRFKQVVKVSTVCGSLEYAAPEMFAKDYDPFQADVFSLGVVAHVLVAGQLPFHIYGGAVLDVQDKVKRLLELKTAGKKESDFPGDVTRNARQLMLRMLDTNPETRIRVDEVVGWDWGKRVS